MMDRRHALVALALAAAGGAAFAAYRRVAPSPDGIGKVYMGREIASVMGWQGAGWLERPEREREEQTERMVGLFGLAPGMRVADVGAGTGYIARRMARVVGPGGRVLAIDVQPEMVKMLRELAATERLAQIEPVLGAPSEVPLAAASVDVAVMVDVYHELEHPREMLASIVRALKPTGRLVFVEYKAEDPAVPIKPLHKMSVAQVRREVEPFPLELERVDSTLPWQHVIVFRKR